MGNWFSPPPSAPKAELSGSGECQHFRRGSISDVLSPGPALDEHQGFVLCALITPEKWRFLGVWVIWFYLQAHKCVFISCLLDTFTQVCVESWIYFSWQLKQSIMFGLISDEILMREFFFCNLVISPHFCVAATLYPFQLNCCFHFKQMKAYFSVYDLLEQTIGRGRLKFWA